MVDPDAPLAGKRPLKDRAQFAVGELARKTKEIPARATRLIGRADRMLDAFEDDFRGKTTGGKLRVIFAIVSVSTLIPGGYIALELWAAKKVVKWIVKKARLRSTPDDPPKLPGPRHPRV